MPSVQQRLAELASTTADLIARLRELEELRERVQKSGNIGPNLAADYQQSSKSASAHSVQTIQ